MSENGKKIGRLVTGFMLCVLLAGFSFWMVAFSGSSHKLLFSAIAVLAFVQSMLNLFRLAPTQPE